MCECVYLRGILPRGNSSCVSCTRIFWKSTNTERVGTSSKLERLAQASLAQCAGYNKKKAFQI